MHHPLLAARLVVGQQLGALVERLADSGDVAVAEDAEAAAEEPLLDPVALNVLGREEPDQRLCGRESQSSALIASSSCSSSASSRPPAIRRTSSGWSISPFA